MKDLTPDQYLALLNQCGLNVATEQLSAVGLTFVVKHGDVLLGQVHCHSSRTIPASDIVKYNLRFIEEMQRTIGIRTSEMNRIRSRLLTMNKMLTGLTVDPSGTSSDSPQS